tara:strand:+ start:5482 stop:5766 length:285 start_codon:yes stop_codon:yes gene_type:complete
VSNIIKTENNNTANNLSPLVNMSLSTKIMSIILNIISKNSAKNKNGPYFKNSTLEFIKNVAKVIIDEKITIVDNNAKTMFSFDTKLLPNARINP